MGCTYSSGSAGRISGDSEQGSCARCIHFWVLRNWREIRDPRFFGQCDEKERGKTMKGIWNKIAAVLALIIGAMAVFAGGKVLLGIDPGYYVIDWVPVYNFGMGVITVFFTAVLVWKNHRFALLAAGTTLAAHALVMIILWTV